MISINKPVLQQISDELFSEKGVKVFVLRDDLIHPFISGNKWRKLKYNLEEFLRQKKEYMLTFGGAYSNHIIATAAAGKEFGIKTIGIIRGEEERELNDALKFAESCGMKLFFISRENYRNWKIETGNWEMVLQSEIHIPKSEIYFLPEGGSNHLAVKGCSEIISDINVVFDYLCCAVGTGATLAGISESLSFHQKAIGISVLRGEKFLEDEVKKYFSKNNFQVNFDYHFGGYAKSNDELRNFCDNFFITQNILIEPVYTGKLFFGLYNLISNDFFEKGKTIVAVHTGGVFDFNI